MLFHYFIYSGKKHKNEHNYQGKTFDQGSKWNICYNHQRFFMEILSETISNAIK